MGSADVVPGVSGGTVALVTGIYPRLVATISAGSKAGARFVRFDIRGGVAALKKVDWWFIISLLLGAGAAVLTLSRVIEQLLHDEPIRIAGVFLGMIGGTIVIAWRLLKEPSLSKALIAGPVGIVSFMVFGLQSAAATDPSAALVFGAGMLAIMAFILPGVSGSFLLLSIGMYQAVLGAVNDRELATVAIFGLGAILGLGIFSRVLERLLERHYDVVVSILIGLMLGSFRILWPWPNGLGDEDGVGATVLGMPSGDVMVPGVLAAAAAVVVVVFALWADRPKKTPRRIGRHRRVD
jgi:putative membrane protein